MMTFDTTALVASLNQFHMDAVNRMERMVRGFAYQFALRAVQNTPIGNSRLFASYYNARTDLPKVEGLSRGNWQFDLDGSFNLQIIAGQGSGEAALDVVEAMSSKYRLGNTFYIGNVTPYIEDLEANRSYQTNGAGIMQPTLDDITGVYSVNFRSLYDSNR